MEESLKNSGTDQEELDQIRQELEESGKEGGSSQEGPTEGEDVRLKRLRDSLMGVYTDPEVYGPVFGNMYDRFGVYNVMDAYNYTSEPSVPVGFPCAEVHVRQADVGGEGLPHPAAGL